MFMMCTVEEILKMGMVYNQYQMGVKLTIDSVNTNRVGKDNKF